MSDTPRQPETNEAAERLAWLLAQRETEGLDLAERRELAKLFEETGASDDDALAYAAAALQRNETEMLELPFTVRRRLELEAQRFASGGQVANTSPGMRSAWGFVLGALSAAAVIALAFLVFQFGVQRQAEPTDWLAREWSGVVEGYESVTGQVRWSADRQGGEMRFRGLPENDPAQGQYQLWIVDPTRDAEPVDGGVFDVKYEQPGGEAVVSFDAKLRVDQPTVFAVTYEQPGGVVVSEGPLLVVAAVDKQG